ncbi:MAG: T9SS type A sorting domain-containing protein [Candidatus Latescibacteria bacterium]|nr:T9SS type A sorting domain-containing protein [Candidatus Latescibacterota bacterium]
MKHYAVTLFAAVVLLHGAFLETPSAADSPYVEILESDATGMTLRVRAPELRVKQTIYDGKTLAILNAAGLPTTSEEERPRIPFIVRTMVVPPEGEVAASVIHAVSKTRSIGFLPPHHEVPLDGSFHPFSPSALVPSPTGLYPASMVSVRIMGFVRENRVAALSIYPYQVGDGDGTMRVHTEMTIRVDFEQGASAAKALPCFPASPSPPFERMLSEKTVNYSQSKMFRRRRPVRQALRKPVAVEDSLRIRIVVKEDGLYKIDWNLLEEAEIDLSGVDPGRLRITHRGQEVPILVAGENDGAFDPEDWIEFYGTYNRETFQSRFEDMYKDPYSDENVYWLSVGAKRGMRLAGESGAVVEVDPLKYNRPVSYEYTVHAERDGYRDRLARLPEENGDRWFWDSGIDGGRRRDYEVDLPDPDRNALLTPVVTVMLRGKTYPSGSPDHHALIYLNDILVGDQVWDDQALVKSVSDRESPFRLSSAKLVDGENRLGVVLPGDEASAGAGDAVYLNWFEVEYPRLYWAEDDYIEFTKPKTGPNGLYHFVIGGFTSPNIEVYKKGISKITGTAIQFVEGKQQKEGYYQVSFQDAIYQEHTEYIALTPDRKKSPVSVSIDSCSHWKSPEWGADYLLITHENFYETAERLAQFRRSQSLQVQLVDVQDIYDEFNDGITSPEAIHRFLKYAYTHWDPAPTYVLLIGDGTWDYKSAIHHGHNFIPVPMVQTYKWGSAATDHIYALVSGDDLLPDLLVGRLPVSTNTELEPILDKIIQSESQPKMGRWRGKALFIGGAGSQFRDQCEGLISDFVPPEFDVTRLYLDKDAPKAYFGGTQDLIDTIDEGVSLITFLGHGGGAIWSDASLMRFGDVKRLHNAKRLPFILSFTCFTGAFDEARGSLGEEFLAAANRGAIGFLGSSGLGWVWNDYWFAQSLMFALFQEENETLGSSIAAGKIDFLSKHSGVTAHDIVHMFSLLGDPATRLGFPSGDIKVALDSKAYSKGSPVRVEGALRVPASGTAEVRAFDAEGASFGRQDVSLTDGQFSASLLIPESASRGIGQVKVYAQSNESEGADWIGQAKLAVDTLLVTGIQLFPEAPLYSDSVWVQAEVWDQRDIKAIWCVFPSKEDSVAMLLNEGLWRTERPLVGTSPGEEVPFHLSVLDAENAIHTTSSFRFRVRRGGELVVEDVFLAGEQEVLLSARIGNYGDGPSEADEVVFFLGDPANGGERIGAARVPSLTAGEPYVPFSEELEYRSAPGTGPGTTSSVAASAIVSVPLRALEGRVDWPLIGEQTIFVQVCGRTYSNWITVDRFDVTPEAGIGGAATGADRNLRLSIGPDEVSAPGVLRIVGDPDVVVSTQPDFSPVRLPGYPEGAVYTVSFSDSAQHLLEGSSIPVTIRFDATDSATVAESSLIILARWEEESSRWVRLEGSADSSSVSAQTDRLGKFTLLFNRDDIPPTIEVAVEDQQYLDGAYVPRRPKISAIFQDENGVDFRRGLVVTLDGTAVDPSLIRFPEHPSDVSSFPLNFYPDLDTGTHTVTFEAMDCAGNPSGKKVMAFRVVASFDLIHLGNYPNPFEKYTIFTYTLTSPADKVSFKIYSVSGRLVKQFSSPDDEDAYQNPLTSSAYHELDWDGTDDDGNELANGVYFCRVKAVSEGGKTTVEKIMRLARTR